MKTGAEKCPLTIRWFHWASFPVQRVMIWRGMWTCRAPSWPASRNKELEYRLKKELWKFSENRIAVRFEYEYHDGTGQWFRAYSNEMWKFAPADLMQRCFASINEAPIGEDKHRRR